MRSVRTGFRISILCLFGGKGLGCGDIRRGGRGGEGEGGSLTGDLEGEGGNLTGDLEGEGGGSLTGNLEGIGDGLAGVVGGIGDVLAGNIGIGVRGFVGGNFTTSFMG
jgi:hypothetical protein